MSKRRVVVFGPAYLDRVLRVDRRLVGSSTAPPVDQSVEGVWKFGPIDSIQLIDPAGDGILIAVPPGWPGPAGEIHLSRGLRSGQPGPRAVRGVGWQDELGGMGAGFAAALDGRLFCALGCESDPMSREIVAKLARCRIRHRAIRVDGQSADWTLLITSGPHGDKLPIGFRGCHTAVRSRL